MSWNNGGFNNGSSASLIIFRRLFDLKEGMNIRRVGKRRMKMRKESSWRG